MSSHTKGSIWSFYQWIQPKMKHKDHFAVNCSRMPCTSFKLLLFFFSLSSFSIQQSIQKVPAYELSLLPVLEISTQAWRAPVTSLPSTDSFACKHSSVPKSCQLAPMPQAATDSFALPSAGKEGIVLRWLSLPFWKQSAVRKAYYNILSWSILFRMTNKVQYLKFQLTYSPR